MQEGDQGRRFLGLKDLDKGLLLRRDRLKNQKFGVYFTLES